MVKWLGRMKISSWIIIIVVVLYPVRLLFHNQSLSVHLANRARDSFGWMLMKVNDGFVQCPWHYLWAFLQHEMMITHTHHQCSVQCTNVDTDTTNRAHYNKYVRKLLNNTVGCGQLATIVCVWERGRERAEYIFSRRMHPERKAQKPLFTDLLMCYVYGETIL